MARKHRLLCAAAMVMASLMIASPGSAQQRGQTVRIVVPTVAGGAADAVARLMGQRLQEDTGVTVLVENKAGGLFAPALRDVANSPADGTTIFMVTTSVLMSQVLHPEIPYDLTRDYTPIIEVATGPLILVGRKDLPFNSVAGLVAHAKKNPGKLVFASPGGNGSAFSLAAMLLMSTAGIEALNVPYKSAAPALNDLLGGHVDIYVSSLPQVTSLAQSGQANALAVTSAKRASLLPNVPTLNESGIPGFDLSSWWGIVGPAGVPANIVNALNTEIGKMLISPDLGKFLANEGAEAEAMTPQQFENLIHAEIQRWIKVAREANISID
jgi:tripartite-type tricarboxylate transporter receptor subunit TctC